MEDFKISQDIYEESLKIDSYRISDDVYYEAESVTKESLLQELSASYKFSGRYWIWKMSNVVRTDKWKQMLHDNEMQIAAPGLKYLLSFPDLASLHHEFITQNVGKCINPTRSAAYFAFSHYLRRGDALLVIGRNQKVVAWGIVESSYMYRPTRSYGRHYRKVAWNEVNLPYLFTDKNEILFQVPSEETVHLQETLIGNLVLDKSLSPFGFVR